MLGKTISRYYREPLVAQTGLSARRIEAALRELAANSSPDRPWIIRDDRVLWIRNGLKYDPGLNLDNFNNMKGVARAVAGLPRSNVVEAFLAYYPQVAAAMDEDTGGPDGGPPQVPYRAPQEAPRGASSSSSTPIPIQEQEQEQRQARSRAPHAPSAIAIESKGNTKTNIIPNDIPPREYNLAAAQVMQDHPTMPADEIRDVVLRTIRMRPMRPA
jgi:hypothetical protein